MCTVENNNEAIVRGELLASSVQAYISVRSAYDQCAPEIKAVVDDMIALCNDPDATPDDKKAALSTVVEALFPLVTADFLESTTRFHRSDVKGREEAMQCEATFSERVEAIMRAKGINQDELASKSGVGQPAISNMLRRECRPQQRTIARIAAALEVAPEDLWVQEG